MKKLVFNLIAGYPYLMTKEEMTEKLNIMVKEVKINLAMLPGVTIRNEGIRFYGETNEAPIQARVYFEVKKEGRKTTWDDIMEAVNKVYAPNYRFVTC